MPVICLGQHLEMSLIFITRVSQSKNKKAEILRTQWLLNCYSDLSLYFIHSFIQAFVHLFNWFEFFSWNSKISLRSFQAGGEADE